MELSEVAALLKEAPCSLFLGAGASVSAGGPTGRDLFDCVKMHFKSEYSGTDFFELMDGILKDPTKRAEAEKVIKDNLCHIGVTSEHQYLFSLPWKAVMTTNYDKLPDSINMTLDGNRQIKIISSEKADIDMRRHDILYCFKLFGDMDAPSRSPSALVLTNSDRRRSYYHGKLFRQFFDLAASSNYIYIGYSFTDRLALEILEDMSVWTERSTWPGFAISPSEPSVERMAELQKYNIKWIKGTFESFIAECKKVFTEIPQSLALDSSPIRIHGKSVVLPKDVESNIFGRIHPLRQSDFGQEIEPVQFFSSNDWSFEPFRRNYDYRRRLRFKVLKQGNVAVISSVHDFIKARAGVQGADNKVFCITGAAGSGKTVLTRRLAYEWYISGNPALFFESPFTLDQKMILDLLDVLNAGYTKYFSTYSEEPKPVRFLLIFEKCKPYVNQIIELHNYLTSIGKPIDTILVERKSALIDREEKMEGIDILLEIDDTIRDAEVAEFRSHFTGLGIISDPMLLSRNVRSKDINTSFFSLLYTSLRGIQEPLKKSLIDEFSRLNEIDQRIYSVVSVFSVYEQKAFLPLVAKVCELDPQSLLKASTSGRIPFISYDIDNELLLLNQRIVAEIIADHAYSSNPDLVNLLQKIVDEIDYSEENQIRLVHELIPHRIFDDYLWHRKLSFKEKERLFLATIEHISSAVLWHHLALLYLHNDRTQEARQALDEAYGTEEHRKTEPIFSLKDTEGRIEMAEARKADNIELALSKFAKAELIFMEARVNHSVTPHPFAGLAEVYLEMARRTTSPEDKRLLLIKGISACSSYSQLKTKEFYKFDYLEPQILEELEKIGFDAEMAKEIARQFKNGDGFAFLAEELVRTSLDYATALRLVNDGLAYDPKSGWLNSLKVEYFKKIFPEDLQTLGRILIDWQNNSGPEQAISLMYELAKYKYISGLEAEALSIFNQLKNVTRGIPKRLLIEQEKDTWNDKDAPKQFRGRIIKSPWGGQLGLITCISDQRIKKPLLVAQKAFRYDKPKEGDDVYFQITFNITGPRAANIRL